ncbi:uncharacterized protein LOC113367762 [Ctenocephalides felis]|uniref:uncharacterized protein LOC113367762 n=1 Tax=Ctenocephalides felis TaxID=7515 RepID=UPI000E6E1172|nr:uncharacterized protein LOC113367762 [Ctenocephalides felis]
MYQEDCCVPGTVDGGDGDDPLYTNTSYERFLVKCTSGVSIKEDVFLLKGERFLDGKLLQAKGGATGAENNTVVSVTSPSEFIYKTHRGLSCHFEIPNHNTLSTQLDYLSNLTPHSQTYNKTSRNKRDLLTSLDATKKFQMNYDEYLLRQEFHKRNYKHEALMRAHNLRKHKLNRQHTNVKVSKLITNQDKCELIRFYGWMFTLAYIAFVIFLVRFLILCESAVFTMSLITMALPFAGLYWSVFKLVPQGNVAIVEWGPAVTGEMICCLLGLPIVMLGTILLCKAHFRDCKQISYRSFDSGMA